MLYPLDCPAWQGLWLRTPGGQREEGPGFGAGGRESSCPCPMRSGTQLLASVCALDTCSCLRVRSGNVIQR